MESSQQMLGLQAGGGMLQSAGPASEPEMSSCLS